jgi:Family of unknown function (DUF5681)
MDRKGRKKKDTNFYPESVGDYPVGYGVTPEGTRFKPGVSPNPTGRPRGSKNKSSPDKLSDMIQEEGHRMIEVKERGKLKKMPTALAIIRGIYLSAASGNSRAHKLAMDMMTTDEDKRRDERNARFDAAVDYKKWWAEEIKLRRQLGKPEPDVFPHPDHFILNYATQEVTFVGLTSEQQEYVDRLVNARKFFQTAISQLMELGKTTDEHEYILEDLLHALFMLQKIDKALGATWAEDFHEVPDWDKIKKLKDKLMKDLGLV